MPFSAVIFDIGGVLEVTEEMDFDIRWEQRLGLERGQIVGRLADVWSAGSIGTITEPAFRDAIIGRLELEPHTADELIEDIWRQYLGVANSELIAYAKTLRPRHRTGIISNSFVGAREREQRAYGFEDLVDDAQIALDGATAAGMTTIHHTDNATTITALNTLLHTAGAE
ncbi:Uncharacterised protein [Nocardia otitidiscaviarum]|uniref:HAD family phosphatase n=1 Tax=Nocardia otitidiscaviarum TaxID=1823 RepID=A0A378YW83_9NOCA|nr:hypothetical protein [Nocardia otitidiscaviarum]SUA80790.1 Uncharacterised protein [Nocardia otitidiscaviarum]